MIVYRLSKSKYCRDLSGKGAEESGARWNSKGQRMLYTSQSRALCTAEIAVHTPLGIIPSDYVLTTIEIPANLTFLEINLSTLVADWKSFPYNHYTQKVGDNFIANNLSLILKVPSAVVQGDFNFLINPNHPEFKKIKIIKTEAFIFDERLFLKQ